MQQDPPNSPFALLGVQPRFDLDLRQLRAMWMQRAAGSHPDAAGEVQASAVVNDAYRALLDPIERAIQLLAVRHAPSVDVGRMPDGFLLEMIELREQADAESEAGRPALVAEAQRRRAEAIDAVRSIFGTADGEAMSAEEAQAVHTQLNVVRAFDRMLEQLAREATP